MNVNLRKEKETTGRNARAELRALMRRDLLLPAVVGFESEVSPDAISEWLHGERKSADFVARIVDFIDSYNNTWEMLTLADNATRAGMAIQFISNIRVLLDEVESAVSLARRGELRDVLVSQIAAARRVVEMMGAEAGQSPEQFAAAIRKSLRAGDTMLIKRGGQRG